MKVGVVLKKFPVISESFILRQIEALSGSSVAELVIFTDFYDEELLKKLSPSLYDYVENQKVEIIYNKNPSSFVFFNDTLDHVLRAFFSSPFFIINSLLNKKVNFSNAIYSHFVRKFFKKRREDVDVYHFHFLTTYVSFSLLKNCIPTDKKFVVSVRGYDCTRYSALNQHEVGLIKHSPAFHDTYFLPVSESLKTVLASKGISDHVAVNYSGIDTEQIIASTQRFKFDSKKIKFIQVGRLVDKKGFSDSLVALSKLKDEYDFEFHIVGSGPNLTLYKEQVEKLSFRKNVIFHGALLHKETLNLIEDSDCLLVPSKTAPNGDMEGIPNVIKEAMLLGTLVIASRHSGIPEVVNDGQTGFLHDEGSIDSQVDAIRRFFDAKESWPLQISNARDHIKKNFDIGITTKDLIAVYDKLLSAK